MSDTWNQIQDFKNKQLSLREKLKRRKAEREGLVADLLDGGGGGGGGSKLDSPAAPGVAALASSDSNGASSPASKSAAASANEKHSSPSIHSSLSSSSSSSSNDLEVEANLYVILCDVRIPAPTKSLRHAIVNLMTEKKSVSLDVVDKLLRKIADDNLISLEATPESEDPASTGKYRVVGTEQSKVVAMASQIVGEDKLERMRKRKRTPDEEDENDDKKLTSSQSDGKSSKKSRKDESGDGRREGSSKPGMKSSDEDSLDFLLSATSTKEKEIKEQSADILYLLSKPTAKEQSLSEKFRSAGGSNIKDFCNFVTKEECKRQRKDGELCQRVHYRKILYKHTDETLGDCSFLNTCFHMDTCKYVHYEMDDLPQIDNQKNMTLAQKYRVQEDTMLWPAQWVQCDLRFFDMSVLGKFTVIMADPPWDIHMELPYGTMSDDEMRKLPVPCLSEDGYIFLWVTGRAMELGRECLRLWGYERVDEIIWVKTNQLQRIIRTGRTGHWINHGKEHCIVGVKGNPQGQECNRGFDCDIIVAEVRATSHKPDEIYGLIERLAPGKRKIELFGRPHNSQPNWTTLGNQVDGVRLSEPDVVKRFKAIYPDGNCMRPPEWWKQQQKALQQKQKEQAEKFQQI